MSNKENQTPPNLFVIDEPILASLLDRESRHSMQKVQRSSWNSGAFDSTEIRAADRYEGGLASLDNNGDGKAAGQVFDQDALESIMARLPAMRLEDELVAEVKDAWEKKKLKSKANTQRASQRIPSNAATCGAKSSSRVCRYQQAR